MRRMVFAFFVFWERWSYSVNSSLPTRQGGLWLFLNLKLRENSFPKNVWRSWFDLYFLHSWKSRAKDYMLPDTLVMWTWRDTLGSASTLRVCIRKNSKFFHKLYGQTFHRKMLTSLILFSKPSRGANGLQQRRNKVKFWISRVWEGKNWFQEKMHSLDQRKPQGRGQHWWGAKTSHSPTIWSETRICIVKNEE